MTGSGSIDRSRTIAGGRMTGSGAAGSPSTISASLYVSTSAFTVYGETVVNISPTLYGPQGFMNLSLGNLYLLRPNGP